MTIYYLHYRVTWPLLLPRPLDHSASAASDQELHHAPLHAQPDAARDVEQDGLARDQVIKEKCFMFNVQAPGQWEKMRPRDSSCCRERCLRGRHWCNTPGSGNFVNVWRNKISYQIVVWNQELWIHHAVVCYSLLIHCVLTLSECAQFHPKYLNLLTPSQARGSPKNLFAWTRTLPVMYKDTDHL